MKMNVGRGLALVWLGVGLALITPLPLSAQQPKLRATRAGQH